MLVWDRNPPFSQACRVDGALPCGRRPSKESARTPAAHPDCPPRLPHLSARPVRDWPGPWCGPPCTTRPGQGHSPLLPTGTTWPGSFQPKANSGKRKGKEDEERRWLLGVQLCSAPGTPSPEPLHSAASCGASKGHPQSQRSPS